MSKSFKGRVISKGNLSGVAAVAVDQPDLTKLTGVPALQKEVEGKVLCLPKAAPLSLGGLYLASACKNGHSPSAMLFADTIDPESASGILLSANWTGHTIIAVDQLGPDFLNTAKNGTKIEIKDTGEVIVES
jgi:predicted aconitase with swiveling domain